MQNRELHKIKKEIDLIEKRLNQRRSDDTVFNWSALAFGLVIVLVGLVSLFGG